MNEQLRYIWTPCEAASCMESAQRWGCYYSIIRDKAVKFGFLLRTLFCVVVELWWLLGVVPVLVVPLPNVLQNVYMKYVVFVTSLTTKLLGISWDTRGMDILEEKKAYVIVANNPSRYDYYAMFKNVWPLGCSYWLGGFGTLSGELHHIASDILLRDKKKVWFCPERDMDGGAPIWRDFIRPFKTDAFHVAIISQVAVVPVVFSPYHFMREKELSRSGTAIMTVLPPISTVGLHVSDILSLMEHTSNVMQATFNELAREEAALNAK